MARTPKFSAHVMNVVYKNLRDKRYEAWACREGKPYMIGECHVPVAKVTYDLWLAEIWEALVRFTPEIDGKTIVELQPYEPRSVLPDGLMGEEG